MPIFSGTIDNDLLDGTPDADTIIGFAGKDTIFGREGDDLLNGNQGEDTVKGGDGDDWVRGGQDNDELFGDAGNDTLHGDKGNDTAFGGDGDDQLFGDTGEEANFTGNGNDVLYGGLGNDSLFGLAGNDLLLGSDGNDFFCGNKGNDTVFGEDDNDLIRGGQDNDLLFGGAGNDFIFGDLGTDTVTGGEGEDTFVIGRHFDVPGFRTTGGLTIADADSITDFIKGQDLIELIGGLTFEELNIFKGSGTNIGDTIIQDKFTGEYLAILQGIDASKIGGTDFTPPGITQPPVGTLQFSAANFSINENGTPVAAITITRTDGSSGAIGVQVILNGGSAIGGSSPLAAPKDYDNSFITVNWADGDTSPKTVTIPVFNDTEVEGNETVNLTLDLPTGGATIGTQNTAVLTIVDNDTQPIPGTLSFTSANYSDNEGNSGTPNKIVGTIQRTGGSDRTVTVEVQLGEGSTATPNDFTNNLPITVTFNPGETSKTVEFPILGDTIPEGNDTINLKLVNPTGGASLGTQQTATYTIVNDDITTDPEIEVLDGATNIADGTATAINFGTTTVNTPAIKTFTVKNAGNAALTLSGLTLPDGFSLVGNLPSSIAAGSDATFQVQLSANATGNFNGNLQFTNNDSNENPFDFSISGTVEPPPNVSITATDAEAAEVGGNTGNYRITRTGNTGNALTVNLGIDDSSTITSNAGGAFPIDYNFSISGGGSISGTGANLTLVIPAGQSFVDVTLTPVDDIHAEANETLKFNLAAGNYTIDGTNNNATVTILANDTVVINTNDIVGILDPKAGPPYYELPLTASEYTLREGTLQQAMFNASTFPGPDTVSFTGGAASGTINVKLGVFPIIGPNGNETTVKGPGANLLTVRVDSELGGSVFRVGSFFDGGGVSATISGLTIKNGRGQDLLSPFTTAGGITNYGTLNVIDCIISENRAEHSVGGIYNKGNATITNSIISNNRPFIADVAGVLNDGGTLNIVNSTISNNSTVNFSDSGGIYNKRGIVNITNSTISGNTGGWGGGIYNEQGKLNIADSNISANTGGYGGGGGITSFGFEKNATVDITNSTISGNKASQGGGIFSKDSTIIITNSNISGNVADKGGGGISIYSDNDTIDITNSTISDNTGEFVGGGGIYNQGTVNITNSAISGNKAENLVSGVLRDTGGGGIRNHGKATITNSTISGNSSQQYGGGILNGYYGSNNDTVNISNSTISNNTAQESGGGIHNNELNNVVNTKNAIIAGNTAATGSDFRGTLTSQGYNLIGDTSGTNITGTTTGNILNVAANLGPLQDNGGSTQTMALLPNSPAINAGDPNFTPPPNTDQRGRGFDRIQGGRLDIGAFESNLLPPAIVSIAATDEAAAEVGNNTGTFRITRTDNTASALTVNLAIDANSTVTSNAGSAFPIDYDFSVSGGGTISGTGANRSLIIPNGQSFVDLIVTPANDEHAEADETLKLNLASGSYTIDGTNNNGTVTIIANDTVVINTNDSVDNYALREGSLRQAMLNAISFAGADTISFADAGASGIIDLAAKLPDLSGGNANNTTINGPGANILTVRDSVVGNDPSGFNQTLFVNSGVNASISGLRFDDKAINNTSTIDNRGTLNITSTTFSGGGISNSGSLNITSSTLPGIGNGNTGIVTIIDSTLSGGRGSGISNPFGGTVNVTNSTISNHTTVSPGLLGFAGGGGILNGPGGTVNLTNSTISGNTIDIGRGGGIYNQGGTINVTDSNIFGNTSREGGGIYNKDGRMNITNSTISNNTTNSSGSGGISNEGGTVNVTNSTISNNTSNSGGGIDNNGGTVTVISSTLSNNTSFFGGGIANNSNGQVQIVNSTISTNTVSAGGGGIFNTGNSTVRLTNSTISNNKANKAGGINNAAGTVIAKDTIIAGNTVTDTSPFSSPDFAGGLTSQGYNLIGNTTGTTIAGTTTGNILNVAANLGPLQDNGGSTQTMALLANSPAINAGDPNFTPPPNTDQRGTGFDRVTGGRIDIGAFESNFSPEIAVRNGNADITDNAGTLDFGTTTPGNPITQRVTINNTGTGFLTLRDLVLPAGFTLVETFPTTVAAGSSANFNVRLNANSVGIFSGELRFNNNDADENPFNFIISGTVA